MFLYRFANQAMGSQRFPPTLGSSAFGIVEGEFVLYLDGDSERIIWKGLHFEAGRRAEQGAASFLHR